MPLIKNIADLLEKLAAGALCVGLFQDNSNAVIIGTGFTVVWAAFRLIEFYDSL